MAEQALTFREKVIGQFLQLTSGAKAGALSVYATLTTALFTQMASTYQTGGAEALGAYGISVGTSMTASLLADHVYHAQARDDTKALIAKTQERLDGDKSFREEVEQHLQALQITQEALLQAVVSQRLSDDAREWFVTTIRQELAHLDQPQPVDPHQEALRQAYLNHLYEEAGEISLVEVDRQATAHANTPVMRAKLGDIYVPLLTAELEREESPDKEGEARLRGAEGDDPRAESRPLSAVTQLERHPRLVLLGAPGSGKTTFAHFVAQCLAGETLGKQMNLSTLATPVPKEGREKERTPEPWSHGPLLPVLVELRKVAAVALPPVGETAGAIHLTRFLDTELAESGLQEFAPLLRQLLRYPGGLVILDGLDEVPEAEQRRAQILQMIEDFAALHPNCRLLVTSRSYSYIRQDWRLRRFHEAELPPFTPAQIEAFVDRWYEHTIAVGRRGKEDAQGRASRLKEAIRDSARLAELAVRPLLLTLMAALHDSRGGDLPEKRWQLYEETVELLLIRWNRRLIERTPQGEEIVLLPDLAAWLKVDREKVRQLLNRLAFEAHASQPNLRGTADIAEKDLVNGLWELTQRSPGFDIAQIVDFLKLRAGILLPHGDKVYTFPHRTLQEYLAACHSTTLDGWDTLADLARKEPDRWREVVLLGAARAADGFQPAVWDLADALCPEVCSAQGHDPCDAWGALIAGHSLVESANLQAIPGRRKKVITRLQGHLVRILHQGDLPATERASGGRLLAQLGDGDPRRGVTSPFHIDWRLIPTGSFTMGSKEGEEGSYDDERPQHQCDIPYSYRISRYPITVAQFQAFVTAGGYLDQQWWTPDGWTWRQAEGVEGPDAVGTPFSWSNHPAIGVSWYEALAFTRWLTAQLSDLKGWVVDLPSEAEWEKAARGEKDARRYPWGNDLDPDRANYYETGIRSTSAAGCFPGGVSPYGAEECSGNVWEWTRSRYVDYPYVAGDGRENPGGSEARVVRGGSWYDVDPWLLRVSCRDRRAPRGRGDALLSLVQ